MVKYNINFNDITIYCCNHKPVRKTKGASIFCKRGDGEYKIKCKVCDNLLCTFTLKNGILISILDDKDAEYINIFKDVIIVETV